MFIVGNNEEVQSNIPRILENHRYQIILAFDAQLSIARIATYEMAQMYS